MDYLHGKVVNDDQEAACHYEYARESEILREAGRLLKSGLASDQIHLQIRNNTVGTIG